MENKQKKVLAVISEAVAKSRLVEYNTLQKRFLLTIINQIIIGTEQSSNPVELDKKLKDLLEFYRFYQNRYPIEDSIVYTELKTKLQNLAKKYNISLK